MARDLHYLAQVMQGYARLVLTGTERVVAQVAASVLEEVVLGTPVDTGFARSNWIVSIGGQSNTTRLAFSPYPKYSGPKLSETANADAAIAAGLQVIGFAGLAGGAKVIYIQNNVDYIGSLNDGSSQQAPAAFVQRAVLVGVSKVAHGFVTVF